MASCTKKQGAWLDNGVPIKSGLVAEYRFDECRNLLKYSQQFDNAAWTKTDCAIAANDTAAPDNTPTADKVTLTVGAAQSIAATYAVTAATAYTYSVWVKLGTATAIKYAIYDLTNSADILAATSYAATTSWARYTYTFTTPAGCVSISIRPVKDSAQDNATTAYLWGAQLEAGSAATTYVPTTDKQTLMDYSKPRKNLLLPNQANACEDNVATWFTKVTAGDAVTASTTVAWKGTYSAKAVCANAAASEGLKTTDIIYGLNPSTTYTASAYVYGSAAGETVKIGLEELTDAASSVGVTYANLTLGASWQRVTVSRTFGATGRAAKLYVITQSQQACTMYVDGLQLEEGSTATAWEAPPNIGILGSAVGADTNDPTWTGNGAYFTTDDYCVIPHIPGLVGNSGITCIAVITNTESAAIHAVIDSEIAAGKSKYAMYLPSDETVIFGGRSLATDTFKYIASTATCSGSTTPYFLVGILDLVNGSATIQINQTSRTDTGKVWGQTTFGEGIGATSKIGSYATVGSCLAGTIHYMILYNRVLTASEISKNYAYLKSYLLKNRGIALP